MILSSLTYIHILTVGLDEGSNVGSLLGTTGLSVDLSVGDILGGATAVGGGFLSVGGLVFVVVGWLVVG